MKTIVVGLGNPILTDDGAGVKVAYALKEALRDQMGDHEITVTEASIGGLRLMELLEGYERAIIVDTIQTHNGQPAGTIYRLTLEDLQSISPTQHSASAHDTSLVNALETGRRLGIQLPQKIDILAIEAENVLDFSEEPTPAVAAAIPQATVAVLEILQTHQEVNHRLLQGAMPNRRKT